MRAMISPESRTLFSAAVAQRESERVGEVVGRGGSQVGLGHALDDSSGE